MVIKLYNTIACKHAIKLTTSRTKMIFFNAVRGSNAKG